MRPLVKCGACCGSGIVADARTEHATEPCRECGGTGEAPTPPVTQIVNKCDDCPFSMEPTKKDLKAGVVKSSRFCSHQVIREVALEYIMQGLSISKLGLVADPTNALPPCWCPLRRSEVVVRLADGIVDIEVPRCGATP